MPILVLSWMFGAIPSCFAQMPDPSKAPTPEAVVAAIQMEPGLGISLVASAPLIQSPVAGAFDHRGRLWVVEMPDYPNGPPQGGKPAGTIKILEDQNGDGVFDRSTVFASGLLFANGILPWKNGAIVTCAPHILFLADTDGDGQSERSEIWFEGFEQGNPQLRVSFPILGPDGWVYVANGLRGGSIRRHGASKSQAISIQGQDFRFHPETLAGEAIAGPGQFGNTFDSWGHRFVCDNRHHLRQVVLENRFVKRNPVMNAGDLLADIAGEEAGPLSSGGKVYPISRNWTTSNLHAGRFTAACGVMVFEGTGLGAEHQGSVFTCDPTGNLIHEERLFSQGGAYRAESPQKGREFLACSHEWFRPVSLITGPDGCLYVIDMCRAVIEHPEFMPPELRNRPDLTLGREKGRIWKIHRKGNGQRELTRFPENPDPAELTRLLDHQEGWVRQTAHRLLAQKSREKGAEKDLRRLIQSGGLPQARYLAGWLLEGMGSLDEASISTLLGDRDFRVVRGVLSMIQERRETVGRFTQQLGELARSTHEEIRFQVALAAGDLNPEAAATLLAHLCVKAPLDPWTRKAILSSAGQCQIPLLVALTNRSRESPQGVDEALIRQLANQVGLTNRPGDWNRILDLAFSMGPTEVKDELKLALLGGWIQGARAKGMGWDDFVKRWVEQDPKGGERLKTWLARQQSELVQGQAPVGKTQGLMSLLPLSGDPGWDALIKIATTASDISSRLAAIRELGQAQKAELLALLLDSWKNQPPTARREILEAMGRDPRRIRMVLERIERETLSPRDIDPALARQWLAHKDPAIQGLAKKWLAGALPANREDVLKHYAAAASGKGDPVKGALIFAKQCATCHRVGNQGLDVGPDISDTRTKTEVMLLNDILNPNAAIDNNYLGVVVTLKSGRTVTGMVRATNAASLTLVRAENQVEAIPQNDIEEWTSTGQSYMPEGLEKNITVAEMADLLAYLKGWRYLDGKTPVGTK